MMTRLAKIMLLILIGCLCLATVSLAQNTATRKLMMGYQGWFLCRGDNSAANKWVHWFNSSSDPSAEKIGVDFWPAMDEYKDTYNTNMNYLDGSNAKLYSAYDSSTINIHFRWMKEYGIHGVYLQRFLGPVASRGDLFESRNQVLQNVIGAADTYDRLFAVMYDISGVADDGNLYNKLIDDWEYLIDTYDVLNKKGYLFEDDRPVIAIWGIGFNGRGLKPATFKKIIDYFHTTADPKYQAYIMGGVPSRWRTLERDSESDPAWKDIYNSLDMISPWTVGRYNNQSGIDDWKQNRIIPDLNTCNDNGVDYMPVIWPGFSWKNIQDGSLNQIPRNGGNYYWRQAYNAIDAGVEYIYVAMFDEVDEGTAMFKLAENKSQVPVGIQDRIVTLDADGYDLPGDWYLRLAGETQKMLEGSIELTSTIPIKPYDGIFRDFISLCDSRTGWNSGNSLTVNTRFHKRGTGCLQSTGSGADEFVRKFLTPFSAGTSTSIGFWYFISNVSKLDADNQVELGSGGTSDTNEYEWTLDKASLKNGWNYIKLDFSAASITGGAPNMEELNWFRIYHLKNDSVTTMLDDIRFRGADGIQLPVADAGSDIVKIDNDENGNELIKLDASASIDFDGSIDSYSWVKDGVEIATEATLSLNFDLGAHVVFLTVTDNDGHSDVDRLEINVIPEVDHCDSKAGWQSSNILTVNTTDQKKGSGCLQSVGSNADEFSRQFLLPVSADSSTSLGFWYFVSDTSKFDSDNQVELGSGGEPNVNEFSWSLDNMKNGWNYVILDFSEAQVTGGEPDLEKINWFRIYHSKTGTVTTMIDDIKFRGIQGNQFPVADAGPPQTIISDSTGNGAVTLNGSESFDPDGSIVLYSWTEDSVEIATGENPVVHISEGVHIITLTVTDNDGATNEDQVTITVDGGYFDDCDSNTGWDSANLLKVNTVDHKQGQGCLETTGTGTDDFKKVFSKPFSVAANLSLDFWYYVSDVTKLDPRGQVEFGSAGRPDQNEYNWQLNNLKNGWNYISLNFKDAGKTGGEPDVNSMNWIRIYRFKTGAITTRIDAFKLGGVNELPIANAGPDQSLSSNENGKASVTLDGSQSTDPDGLITNYSWTKITNPWTQHREKLAIGIKPTIELTTGTHVITLTVTDDNGATSSDDVQIVVESYTGVDEENQIPKNYSLSQNYPNPFNPSTTIRYSIPQNGFVQLKVYDVLGQEVETLVNAVKTAGYYSIKFDASGLSNGIYYYRIIANDFIQTKKLLLLR